MIFKPVKVQCNAIINNHPLMDHTAMQRLTRPRERVGRFTKSSRNFPHNFLSSFPSSSSLWELWESVPSLNSPVSHLSLSHGLHNGSAKEILYAAHYSRPTRCTANCTEHRRMRWGERGAHVPPPPKKKIGKLFFGQMSVKFWHFVNFHTHISGVTTDPADPAMRGGPRLWGAQKLWYSFFAKNFTHQFSCWRALRWVN